MAMAPLKDEKTYGKLRGKGEGRSTMSKADLVKALRGTRKKLRL